jgi:UDPglucose 6-dehydrogenase
LAVEPDNSNVTICGDAYTATQGAHAVLILTEWDEFKALDFKRIYDSMQLPAFLFDGRNLLDLDALRKIGFEAAGIGQA